MNKELLKKETSDEEIKDIRKDNMKNKEEEKIENRVVKKKMEVKKRKEEGGLSEWVGVYNDISAGGFCSKLERTKVFKC